MADLSLPSARPGFDPRAIWNSAARGEVALAIGIVGIIVLLILPIPSFVLDMLLAISITSAVLILMTALLIKKRSNSPPSRPCCWWRPCSALGSTSPRPG